MTRAGIHADGLLKDAEVYTIFDTRRILGRSPSVMIGKASGLAGIAYWINDNYRLEGDEQVGKKDALVVALKDWIDAEYAGGRQTSLSTEELETKIEELSNGRFSKL
jgi:isopropylmalate/homocitrate/citramalate synthase